MVISDIEGLRTHLQWAITVEHATIPPYQCAMFSVVDQESTAFLTFKYVVREEMLHLALAANLLAAVGGTPRFAGPDVMPVFPGPMPHHDPDPPLILHLERASVEVVRDVFLRIEQPELRGSRPQSDRYDSLGQFYDAVADGIDRLGDAIFVDGPAAQVTRSYAGHGGGTLFAVGDRTSAMRAIQEIVDQGEGSRRSPTEPFGFEGAEELSHYWRFRAIVDEKVAIGEVHPMRRDPHTRDLPPGPLHDLSKLFDASYSLQLQVMERVWLEGDASPLIDDAMVPLMNHAQKPLARALLAQPLADDSGDHAGPAFAWDPVPIDEMRTSARALSEHFDLGPTVETLDQVASLLRS
jgi:Ferritin-like